MLRLPVSIVNFISRATHPQRATMRSGTDRATPEGTSLSDQHDPQGPETPKAARSDGLREVAGAGSIQTSATTCRISERWDLQVFSRSTPP